MDYTLSLSNIEFLKKEIGNSGLTYSHLKDDLIDHVCCDVEFEMGNGLPFERAYEMVKQKIGIDGLERIQHETLYLIDKKYRTMKKTMRIFGLVSPIIMAFGTLFRIEHWPGANIMLVIGFFLLSFLFLPSAIYVSYKEVSNKTQKWTHIIGFLGTFILSISFLFKLMHWPGAGVLMLAGVFLICLIFLPSILLSKLRNKEINLPKWILITAISGLIIYIAGFTFKMMHWPGAGILLIVGAFLLVLIALPFYMYKTYKNELHVKNSFIYLIVVLIWFIVPTLLMSLRVSINVVDSMLYSSYIIDKDIEFIGQSNDRLFIKLQTNEKANEIQKVSVNVIRFIKEKKAGMVLLSNQQTNELAIDSNKNIAIQKIENYTDFGQFNILFYSNENKINELKSILKEFNEKIESVSNSNEYKDLVHRIPVFDLSKNNNEYEILLASLNKLSLLEASVLQVENLALNFILHQHSNQMTVK